MQKNKWEKIMKENIIDQLEDFETKFVYFLHQQGYMGEHIFNERFSHKIEQYRNEFIKGWNYGYRL